MGRIFLIADEAERRAAFLRETALPDFYMEDFSVLGLLVRRHSEAVDLIRRDGFRCIQCSQAVEIRFRSPSDVAKIADLLAANGIGCRIADVVDEVYQG